MAQSWGPRSQMVKPFFGLQEEFSNISKVPGAPRNVNPARSIIWLVRVTIYCTIF